MHPTLAEHLLELVHNSCDAGATTVELTVRLTSERVEVRVKDDGKGMSQEQIARALNPFFSEQGKHPGRMVGLGLPFTEQLAQSNGGELDIRSAPGEGTDIILWYDPHSIDAPPFGDLSSVYFSALTYPGPDEVVVRVHNHGTEYSLVRSELAEALGELESAGSLQMLRDFIYSQEDDSGEIDP